MHPKVTIYIPSHNYGKFLGEAIESVLRQNFDNWELLIIDDQSTDETPNVMQLYSGDNRIRLFRTEGIGLHGVCNLALNEAKGEYLIRLDGDDIFDENILLVLSNFLDRNQDTALVFSDYYLLDEFGDIFSHERRKRLYSNNHMFDLPPNGACFLARVSVLKEVGGYRSDLRAQDGYLIWAKLLGKYKTANLNIPLYYYRQHGTSLSTRKDNIFNARQEIKRDLGNINLKKQGPIILVIPCRKNYDYCLDVWNQKINGISLLEQSIKTATQSNLFDYIVVACDNEDVKNSLNKFEDPRLKFYLRTQQETIRSESVVTTMDKIVKKYDPNCQGIAVLTYMQTPFVKMATLEEAVYTLVINNADSSFAVEEVNRPVFTRSPFGLSLINPCRGVHTDFDSVYTDAYTVLATKTYNLSTGSLTGPKVANFIVSKKECFFVDSDESMRIAQLLYAQEKEKLNSNFTNQDSSRLDYKPMLIAFIQARTSSTRLPGKVLKKDQFSKTLLENVYERVAKATSVGRIVVLTSVHESDDAIVKLCKDKGYEYFRGNLDDVASRFCAAAKYYNCPYFIRVCADRAYYDYRLIDQAFAKFSNSNAEIVTNVYPATFPKGQTVEIIKSKTFIDSYPKMKTPEEREHIFNYFYNNSKEFTITNFETDLIELKSYNMCIDDLFDYKRFIFVNSIAEKPLHEYSWKEILAFFDLFDKDKTQCAE